MGQTKKAPIEPGTVVNTDIAEAAGIDASKLDHNPRAVEDFGFDFDAQPSGTVERIIFIAEAACEVKKVVAGLADTGTSTSIAFNVYKNGSTGGSSVLTGAITVAHTDTDGEQVAGTMGSATLVAGDYLSAQMVVTSNSGALGPFCHVNVDADYVT